MVEKYLGNHETQHCTVFTVCSAWGTKPLKKKPTPHAMEM
jgi:hypothetical protein